MNILFVDDHRVLVQPLAGFIKNEIPNANLFFAEDGLEAMRQIQTVKPDVILLDVNLPFLSGVEIAHHVHKDYPSIKIIMLTSIDGEAMLVTLSKFVDGFLFKNIDSSEVVKAIKVVMGGNSYFCKESTEILIENFKLKNQTPIVKFDKREIEIVERMSEGQTLKSISEEMELKESMLNQFRDILLRKTKTKNSKELIAFAYENGLIFKKKKRKRWLF